MRRDLTEATVFGSMMSMLAAFLMVSLFFFVRPDPPGEAVHLL
jgi:hypothetical protein